MDAEDKNAISRKGKFSVFNMAPNRYEVRKGNDVLAELDNKEDAIAEMELLARLEVQHRPPDSGM